MRRSLVLVPVLVVLAVWAVGCGGGGDGNGGGGGGNGDGDGVGPTAVDTPGPGTAGPEVTAIPGPPGSVSGEPLAFGATGELGALEVRVDRWELLECVPADVTPAPGEEECPDGTAKNRALRYLVSIHNTSDGDSVEGPFIFFLSFAAGGFAIVAVEGEEVFPSSTEALGPGETIEGYVYSVRPDMDRWEGGEVRVQVNIGPEVDPESVLFWQIPPP